MAATKSSDAKTKVKIEENGDLQSALETLNKDRDARTNQCRQEIQQVLDKFNCEIQVSVLVTQQGNIPQIMIVSK